jgi:hypothetical protein
MAFTKADVAPRNINGKLVELSDAEKQALVDQWNNPVDYRTYDQKRREEYPSIEECVHAILDGELDALQAIRAEIKARYPK